MAVYVDDMRTPYRGMIMCHMIGDLDDLHRMADMIGMRREWFQLDHYDISLTKRASAVALGAIEITSRQAAAMRRRHRLTGSPGDPQTAIEWLRNHFQSARIPSTLNRGGLLLLAANHYDPEIVAINESWIEQIDWPLELMTGMRLDLPEQIGNDPYTAIPFLLLNAALQYRFWHREADSNLVRYQFSGKSGARALWTAMEHIFLDSSDPLRTLREAVNTNRLGDLLGDLPDMPSRIQTLKQLVEPRALVDVTRALLFKINETTSVTVTLSSLLAQQFPAAFGDPYLKKAQLAMAMIAAHLNHNNQHWIDTGDLTAMADYRLPNVLHALGVLEYSVDLVGKIQRGELIDAGSMEEHALRAATVLAVEQIADHTGRTPASVDNLLWLSQAVAKDAPFHLTETNWY